MIVVPYGYFLSWIICMCMICHRYHLQSLSLLDMRWWNKIRCPQLCGLASFWQIKYFHSTDALLFSPAGQSLPGIPFLWDIEGYYESIMHHTHLFMLENPSAGKKKCLACWVQYYSLIVRGIQLSGTNYMMSLILDDLQESTILEDSNHLLFGVNCQLYMLLSHILEFLYHPLPLWFPFDQQLDFWRAMNNTLTTSYYF